MPIPGLLGLLLAGAGGYARGASAREREARGDARRREESRLRERLQREAGFNQLARSLGPIKDPEQLAFMVKLMSREYPELSKDIMLDQPAEAYAPTSEKHYTPIDRERSAFGRAQTEEGRALTQALMRQGGAISPRTGMAKRRPYLVDELQPLGGFAGQLQGPPEQTPQAPQRPAGTPSPGSGGGVWAGAPPSQAALLDTSPLSPEPSYTPAPYPPPGSLSDVSHPAQPYPGQDALAATMGGDAGAYTPFMPASPLSLTSLPGQDPAPEQPFPEDLQQWSPSGQPPGWERDVGLPWLPEGAPPPGPEYTELAEADPAALFGELAGITPDRDEDARRDNALRAALGLPVQDLDEALRARMSLPFTESAERQQERLAGEPTEMIERPPAAVGALGDLARARYEAAGAEAQRSEAAEARRVSKEEYDKQARKYDLEYKRIRSRVSRSKRSSDNVRNAIGAMSLAQKQADSYMRLGKPGLAALMLNQGLKASRIWGAKGETADPEEVKALERYDNAARERTEARFKLLMSGASPAAKAEYSTAKDALSVAGKELDRVNRAVAKAEAAISKADKVGGKVKVGGKFVPLAEYRESILGENTKLGRDHSKAVQKYNAAEDAWRRAGEGLLSKTKKEALDRLQVNPDSARKIRNAAAALTAAINSTLKAAPEGMESSLPTLKGGVEALVGAYDADEWKATGAPALPIAMLRSLQPDDAKGWKSMAEELTLWLGAFDEWMPHQPPKRRE